MVQKLKFYSYFPKEVGKARSSDKSEKRVRGELIARETGKGSEIWLRLGGKHGHVKDFLDIIKGPARMEVM